MADIHPSNGRPASFDEKHDEKHDSSGKSSLAAGDESPTRLENGKADTALLLNEQEILARVRAHPDDATPIFLTFSKHDSDNPRQWPKWKKWYITCFASFLNVITCLCAGGYSSAQDDIIEVFGVSAEVATLGLSMYILGFAVGPMVLAPLSEYYGRSPVYIGSWFILFIFQLPVALAPNIATVIVCRFIQGFGGSAPLTNTGGSISDVWERNDSGNAMMIYGVSSTFGPPFALVLSGYIVQRTTWHWLFWIFMIITGCLWVLMVFTLPETRHSTILERKAKQLRKVLGKEGVSGAALQNISDVANKLEKRSLHSLFAVQLVRPFRFLFTEPITMGAAAYNGFIYGVVYLFNEAIPKVFADGHDFTVGEWGCAFAGIAIGVLIAACFYPLQERYYLRRVAENDGKGVPEARMWQARFGALLLPIS